MFQCLWKHPLLHLTSSNSTNRTGSAYWPREGSNFIWTNWFEPCSFRTWYSVVRGTLRFGLNQQHGGCLRSRTGTALHLAYSLVCNKRCLRLVWHAWPVSRSATTSQQGATLLFRCFQPLHNFYLQFVPETEPNLIIVWSQIDFQCLAVNSCLSSKYREQANPVCFHKCLRITVCEQLVRLHQRGCQSVQSFLLLARMILRTWKRPEGHYPPGSKDPGP